MRTRRVFRIRDLQLRAQLISELIQPGGDGYDIGTRTGTSMMDVLLRYTIRAAGVHGINIQYQEVGTLYCSILRRVPTLHKPGPHVCSRYMNAWRAAWRFQYCYHQITFRLGGQCTSAVALGTMLVGSKACSKPLGSVTRMVASGGAVHVYKH